MEARYRSWSAGRFISPGCPSACAVHGVRGLGRCRHSSTHGACVVASLRTARTCPPWAGQAASEPCPAPHGSRLAVRLHSVTTATVRNAQVAAVRYFASGRLWSHSSRIAGCSAFRIAAVGTPGGEQMRADGCLRWRVTGDAEFAQARHRLRGLLQAGYELVAFHCQLLIIAVRVGASDVWSLGIVRNIIKYSMPLRTVIHSA